MSTQKSIIDALITAIEGVSGVSLVTKDMKAWNQADPNSLSVVYVSMEKGEGDQVYFRHPTADDMHAVLDITIQAEIYEQYETNTEVTIDTLMKNIETAVNSDTALNALVIDIFKESDEYVKVDNNGLSTAIYIADYEYNHLSP